MAYSKTQVDRAGKAIADQIRLISEDPRHLDDQRVLEEIRKGLPAVEWWRAEHSKPLSRVAANLRYYAAKQGEPVVAQRLKRVPTIAGKLVRESSRITQLEDIGGVRAVLPDQNAVFVVASQLRRNWTITRLRDYVAKPKPDGYRALHLVNRHRGRMIEIQLRTPRQHYWANMVENVARLVPGLKAGGGPPELTDLHFVLAEGFAMLDEGLPVDQEFMSKVHELKLRADTFIDGQVDEP